jgi:hypothetical protein
MFALFMHYVYAPRVATMQELASCKIIIIGSQH